MHAPASQTMRLYRRSLLSRRHEFLETTKLPTRAESGLSDQPGFTLRFHPSPVISRAFVSNAAGATIVIDEKLFRTNTPPLSTVSLPQGAEKFPDG